MRIGQYLALLGDPRRGVGLTDEGLPDIEWIEIPGGQVKKLKGVDRKSIVAGLRSLLQRLSGRHRVNVFMVKPFRIAKYLVTNKQFDAFLKAGDGYRNKEWWKDLEKDAFEPPKPPLQAINAPRVGITWYEAVAFCRWFSAKTGTSIRLPTEWDWQQAATGGDPWREYPWKGGWDASRCNSVESDVGGTTAVGMYPQGATGQGVLDMAGNAWEWCLDTGQRARTITTGG